MCITMKPREEGICRPCTHESQAGNHGHRLRKTSRSQIILSSDSCPGSIWAESHYTEDDKLFDSFLDVVMKEAECSPLSDMGGF